MQRRQKMLLQWLYYDVVLNLLLTDINPEIFEHRYCHKLEEVGGRL
jgi:hypothetical protein